MRPILVVEDSPEDFEATRRSLQRGGLVHPLVHVENGDAALDYLCRRGHFARGERSPRPRLILLDLNLPGTDGRQVLASIKADEQLRQIPVVVFTTSRDDRDVEACYRAGANSYVQKPVDLPEFRRALDSVKSYWFETVVLPTE
ncbi:MAG TPA: response regulator [Thermoanaerobaculia bacterium]|nr:response regulator [Thermoanaerobaculia bacterium]